MARYHVAEDGVSRICKAATAASCTAVGVDGEAHSLTHMVELAGKLEKSSRRARKPELKALPERLQTAINRESRIYR